MEILFVKYGTFPSRENDCSIPAVVVVVPEPNYRYQGGRGKRKVIPLR